MSNEGLDARATGPPESASNDSLNIVDERTPLLLTFTPEAEMSEVKDPISLDSERHDNALASDNEGSSTCSSGNPRKNGKGQHCHQKSSEDSKDDDTKAYYQLIAACGLCLIFIIGEITGGILANSLAIATDAAHLLTDFASFLISLFSIYLKSRPPTKRMSFGWYRAEVMGALISVIFIWVVTGILVYMAVERVISGNFEIDATIMLITAGCGIVVNLILGFVLGHGHSHGHGHGHSHSHGGTSSRGSSTSRRKSADGAEAGVTPGGVDHPAFTAESDDGEAFDLRITDGRVDGIVIERPKKENRNINVRAAFIHVVGDLVQSIGVLVAAYIIYYKPEWKVADPICTFIFSVLVLFTTIKILVDILNVLMEGAPRSVSFNEVKECLCGIRGVRELHNLRLWSLTVNKTALSVHLALDNSVSAQEVLSIAGRLMRDRFGIYECTVQTEEYVDEMSECEQCQDPKD